MLLLSYFLLYLIFNIILKSILTFTENSDEDQLSYSDLRQRDNRRFEKADANTDGTLSFNEFIDFLHPEDAEHMREVVVAETMEDIDKNKDNVIDEKEYIGEVIGEVMGKTIGEMIP